MVKHILSNGCSFTSGAINHTGDRYNVAWPAVLAQNMNCKVTNLATSGAGNTRIYDLTIKEISENPGKYDLVVIMWTEATRIDIPAFAIDKNNGPGMGYISCDPYRTAFEGLFDFGTKRLKHITEITDPRNWQYKMHQLAEFCAYMNHVDNQEYMHIDKQKKQSIYKKHLMTEWTKIIGLQSFLKSQNIPFIFAQGTGMVPSNVMLNITYEEGQEMIGEFMIESPIIDLVDTDKWVNWYPCRALGGWDYIHKLQDMDMTQSSEDSHPNIDGGRMIADDFHNAFERIYGT